MPKLFHAFVNPVADQAGFTGTKPSDWNAALEYSNTALNAPSGTDVQVRELLTADRSYYVRTDGSDGNNGLTNSAGGAFLTMQHAYDVIVANLDLGGHSVTVNVIAGSYSAGVNANSAWLGGGIVSFTGDTVTPSNITITASAANIFEVSVPLLGVLAIAGFKTVATGNVAHLMISAACNVNYGQCEFGSGNSGSYYHIWVNSVGVLLSLNTYSITGNPYIHLFMTAPGAKTQISGTVTVAASVAFTTYAYVSSSAYLYTASVTYTVGGGITGTRYFVEQDGIIYTNLGGATFLPGSVNGSTATQGQYL